MISFQCSFLSNEVTRRAIIFSFSISVIISLCTYHGISGRVKAIDLIDQMIEDGNLTGKFWGVIKVQHDQITITKYQRTITIENRPFKNIQIGDKISFVAKVRSANSHIDPFWYPIKIRLHGTSSFKYGLSILSVLLVLSLCLRHFGFDRKSFCIAFKEREA